MAKLSMQKPSIHPLRWQPPAAPPRANQRQHTLTSALRVFALPGTGPEDVAIDGRGRILAGLADGRIVRLAPDGSGAQTVADTGGRPLGLEFDLDGQLLVCDSHRGLLCVDVESGSVRTLADRIGATPMIFCSNVVASTDGSLWFTESSQHVGVEYYLADILEHSCTGRLSRRLPNGEVEVIAENLKFANGLVLAPDESWLAVAETGGYRITKIWLSGPRAGQRESLVENLPGFPDNMSRGSDGLIWVALATPRDRLLDLLLPRAPILRKFVWALPDAMRPREKKTVWVQAYDDAGNLVHDLETSRERFYMATGAGEHNGAVFIGSLAGASIARIDLS
ncbi:MAG: SMP-30/gluconolactonase/LRE family protein [Actinomycetota bacterium]|nr:SMP-30/gluconolactonase/LRE family protein [Actinomycetota bacterium]